MSLNIVISGIGGQGSVMASRVLALAAMENGLSVRTSEVTGMAQREGMVTSHVRMGAGLYGAIIPDRQADFLLGLELSETVRALPKVKPAGCVIAATTTVIPAAVHLGLSEYNREALTEYLKAYAGDRLSFLDLDALVRRAGHPKTGNVVMLGALAAFPGLPFSREQLLASLLKYVPEKLGTINMRAFEIGYRNMEGTQNGNLD
jgi:indolepyruvate ferredoxin oxidoreductase beta subunit